MVSLIGCTSYKPIKVERYVDLDRFMGDWYVFANIPTFIEEGAHNAVESYKKNKDGSIATTFTFNADSFDGTKKTYNPIGFVTDDNSNAIWEMQFLWPFKSDYRILYVDEKYQHTIIGRIKRDYVWVMSRTPEIESKKYNELIRIIENSHYDISKIKRVPQQPLKVRAK
ncbi:MAG: lipocalin family protein [Gammaproteobacteria bacterium]|nr:lipocalin family protein [Gammaproteobacteria bacterium]